MSTTPLTHERVVTALGRRSGLPITVAVHSTALGAALGGCRIWHYDDWAQGQADAMRLSSAMTLKCAAAGLDTGGGKSVITLAPGETLEGERRRAALLDLGDLVDSLNGSYRTAEDVGTTAADMLTVRERTEYVVGLPQEHGGTGEPAEATARGVLSSLRVVSERIGMPLQGLRVSISGLGQVGGRLAESLALEGAKLTLSDLNSERKSIAERLSADWVPVDQILEHETDIFVPAGVGGILTAESIERLHTRAVVGPANNQLAADGLDQQIHDRGILWVPDFIVNAGGAIAIVLTEVERAPEAEVWNRVDGIGDTLNTVFAEADRTGTTPLQAAIALADSRLKHAERLEPAKI